MTTVLVVAAHPDDEVIGAGATMARLASEGAQIHVAIVTEGCTSQYPDRPDLIEVKRRQARLALEVVGGHHLYFGELPDMALDTVPLVRVNRFLEEIVRSVGPDIVFTHHANDLNRDHRIVHEATVVACRPDVSRPVRTLLAYDVLGVTNFGGTTPTFIPTLYFAAEAFCDAKVRALRAYDVEVRAFPHPRSPEAIVAQGRVYGSLSGTRWAEAFQVIRDAR